MLSGVWAITKETAEGFIRDDILTKAAAIALYAVLGLAPMILLVLAVTAWLGSGAEDAMIGQVETIVGSQAAQGVRDVVRSTKQEQQKQSSGTISAAVGLLTILFSVSGIFVQLQTSLNEIWHVKPKPTAAWLSWLRARLLSIGTLLSVLFLLLVSLVVTAAIAMLFAGQNPPWQLLNLGVSLVVYTALFALIFRLLPDVTMRWRDVWVGATFTAVLFAAGRFFIGFYLGHSAVASSYGAAGSLVALTVWVYYSAIIVLVGAEVTEAYARRYGAGMELSEFAVPNEGCSENMGKGGSGDDAK